MSITKWAGCMQYVNCCIFQTDLFSTPTAPSSSQDSAIYEADKAKVSVGDITFIRYVGGVCYWPALLFYSHNINAYASFKGGFRDNGFAAHCLPDIISVGAVAFQVCGRWQCDDVVVHVFT